MGFGVNFNKPMIQETQSMHDGGAGNLGYFEQKEKEHKEKSIFSDEKEVDTFEKHELDNISDDFSFSELVEKIISTIKSWFKKIFNLG